MPLGARLPLSNAPLSLVIVWVTLSLLVQVALVPALMVRVPGEKEKLDKVTELLVPEVVVAELVDGAP